MKVEYPILIKDLGLLKENSKSSHTRAFGIYECPYCGNNFKAQITRVKHFKIKSCGCLRIKHGLWKHALFSKWSGMIERTENKNNISYKDYGSRGITICKEWRNDFKAFYDWAINNGYKKGLSIDRINVNGNYEPLNCRFTSQLIQSQNQRLIMATNTSGYRGISYQKSRNKWMASISVKTKRISLGRYNTAIEAAKAYDNYVIVNKLEHPINFN